MRMLPIALGLSLATAVGTAHAAPTIAQLRAGHRLLIVSAPGASAALTAQRRVLDDWQRQGQERDVATVILQGATVEGASDPASMIRARYSVPATSFAIALVGKDGHVAFRSSEPVTGEEFDKTIDAMPMRRAGHR